MSDDERINEIMKKYGLENKFSNRMAMREAFKLGQRIQRLKIINQLQEDEENGS